MDTAPLLTPKERISLNESLDEGGFDYELRTSQARKSNVVLKTSLTLSQQITPSNSQIKRLAASQNQIQFQAKISKAPIAKPVQSDSFKTSFTFWDRLQIVLVHLIEPTLVGLMIGFSLQISEVPTILYLSISLLVLLPMILTETLSKIRVKLNLTWCLICLSPAFILLKAWIYCQITPTPNISKDLSDFLGVYQSMWSKTFIIDIVIFTLSCLLAVCYYYQIHQLEQKKKLQGSLKYQLNVKFFHVLFGESASNFYAITFTFYLLDTLLFQTVIPGLFTLIQLCVLYKWATSQKVKFLDFSLRTMQILGFMLLASQFVLSFPLLLDSWIGNHQKLLQILGLGSLQQSATITLAQVWFTRVHMLVLTYAIVLTEVYFVSQHVYLVDQQKKENAQQIPKSSSFETTLKPRFQTKKKPKTFIEKFESLLEVSKQPLTLWTCRFVCFIQVYLYHDYQSLVFLIWLLSSTVYTNTSIFVRFTYYLLFPLMALTYIFYFTVNIYGLFDYTAWTNLPKYYNFGFYPMQIPILELGLAYINLLVIALWMRLVFQTEQSPKQQIDMKLDSTTMYQLYYLFIININYLVFLFLIMSGLAKMDLYHVVMLFVFVWAALYPAAFQRNVIWVLLYADFFVLAKYIFTLVQQIPTGDFQTGWYTIVGIASTYNPQSTQEYFRYPPKFDQWVLVLLTFIEYRRSNLLGSDLNEINNTERKIHKSLQKKYPRTSKLIQSLRIVYSHLVVITTFILYIFVLCILRISVLNAISLIILMSLLLAYLNKGLKVMLKQWTFFQYWTAFVLLSLLGFQFLATTHYGQVLYNLCSLRVQSFLYFWGYEVFPKPIWYYFLPYVTMFFFSIILKESFSEKLLKEEKDLNGEISDQALLQQETIADESQANLQSNSNLNETEVIQKRRLVENKERYYEMQCKLSYLVWKAKLMWPVFDIVAQYFHVGVAVTVLAFALYFQIAVLWLLYIIIYLVNNWSKISTNIAYSNKELAKFKEDHTESADSQLEQRVNKLQKIKLDESQQVQGICDQIIKESKDHNSLSVTQRRLLITDSEAVKQYQQYKTEIQKLTFDKRQSLWLVQFVLAVIAVAFMYLSIFITAQYTNKQGHTEMVIPSVDIQNFTVFLAFLSGVYRRTDGDVQNRQIFMDNFYPIILFIFVLIFERISIMWLQDRFGTSDEVIKLFQSIETSMKPIVYRPAYSERTVKVDQHDSFLYQEESHDSQSIDLDDLSSLNDKKQINTRLSQLVNIKINIMVSKAIKIVLEELMILMVWFSAVYKQNILSLLLIVLLIVHTYTKGRTDNWVKYIVTFVVLYEYLVAVLSLSSYSSPVQFPDQIVYNQTIYPTPEYNYLYVPFYYNLTSQLHQTTNVSTEFYSFFAVDITSRKLNGMWIDLIILILLAIIMSQFSHWLLNTPNKICPSLETQSLLKKYSRYVDYDATYKELKMEIKMQTLSNRFVFSMCDSLYTNFGLVMISVILFISIFSKSLLCFGYFIFSMLLIFNFRLILQDPQAHGQQLLILSWLVPYLLADIFVMWVIQYPYSFNLTDKQSKFLGMQKVWDIQPRYLQFGVQVSVYETLLFGFGELFAKGVAYFIIQLQIHLLQSEGYKQFSQQILIDNVKYATAIGTGMAYKQNNLKNQLVLKQAQDYGNLERMLNHVKELIVSRGQTKRANIDVIEEVNEEIEDFSIQFKIQVDRAYKQKIQSLSKATKFYLYMRRNYVDDMLCKLSTEQMLDIIEQYRNGRTSIRTSTEVAIMLQVKTQVLTSMLEELKAKESPNLEEFVDFMQNELQKAQPQPWERVNLDKYDSTSELIKNYLSMLWKITASNTHFICYFFMLLCAISNGGFLYMVYPCLVFGVALLQESRPGKNFWYFVIVYTQIIIILQFTCQLQIWSPFGVKLYSFSQKYNIGLEYIYPYSFKMVLATFYSEILVMTFVLIHIQSETKAGLLNVQLSEYETFTEGLDRYIKLVVLVNNFKALQEYEEVLDKKILKDDELEFSVCQERRYSLPQFNQPNFDESIDLDTEVLLYGVDDCQIAKKHYSLVDKKELQVLMQQIQESRLQQKGLSVFTKLKKSLRFVWDSDWFNDLFPIIRQQKPGKDLYVYFVAVCIFLFAYTFLFYPVMTSQTTTPAEQIQSSQLQAPMIFSIIAIIGFMFFDRIFYSIYALIGVEQLKEKLQVADSAPNRSKSIEIPQLQGTEIPSIRRSSRIRNQSVMVGERRQYQYNDLRQVDLSETNTIDFLDNNEYQSQQAYFRSLVPKYQTKNVFRVAKFYYFWFLIIIAHWYVFFFLTKQPSLCGFNTPYACNRLNQNSALLFFYLVVCVYLTLQAYQIRLGLPELKKGGFMLGNFSSTAKIVFEIWYYIPFLFELRTIIDWTFTKTALDVFQSIKLAQVQSDMYIAKCTNKSYKEKQLGSQVTWSTKLIFGGGLLLFVFALIIVPMLLFSNLNPIAVYNPVTSATLSFAITIKNDTSAGQHVTLPMFETSQVTRLENLTASQFSAFGFGYQSSEQTNIFKPMQTQSIQFSPVSDMVWSITPPKIQLLLTALNYSMYNTDPSIQVYAELRSDFKRLQTQAPTASITVQFPLTNQNTEVQENLIQMIQCSDQVNSTVFPTYSTSILFILQQTASRQLLTPNITSGANLTFYCSNDTSSSNYWSLTQVFADTSNVYSEQAFNADSGFGIFVFNQTLLPASLAAYSSSLIVFYVTIVYLIASSFRSGFVPLSYQIFIENSVMTEDIIMICQSVYIYRVQRNLEKEEELFMILMDIMRSPETLKSITGTSLKKKID